jgi:hypothetical protein
MSSADGIRIDTVSTRGWLDAKRPWESPTRTYTTGRRCACGTRLSIYNPDPHCASCEPDRWADH